MASLAAFQEKLRGQIEGEVRFDSGTLAIYSTDASNYRRVPIGVVIPRHEGDAIAALALARENAMPILARGGGTGLAGQTCNAALVLDFSKYMNRICAIDSERRIVAVEPGVVQSHLNAALAPHGLFFAPDPATKDRCTIGGMVGNNSCGAHSAAYGKTVDNLAALEVLLYEGTRLKLGATGESEIRAKAANGGREGALLAEMLAIRDRYGGLVRQRYPKIPRRVSGYNLDQLLPDAGFNLARAVVGSEGTLAVTLNATLKLVPRPRHTAVVVLGFDDVFLAADQMPWLLENRPQALEGFDHHLIDFAKAKGAQIEAIRLLPRGGAFLLIELGAGHKDELRDHAETIAKGARTIPGERASAAIIADPREQQAVWRLRESGLGAGAYVPGYPRTWPGAEDAAVAPTRLGEYLRRFADLLARHELHAATYYGHFGEGCVHCRIDFDFATTQGVVKFRTAMVEIADLVVEFGGSLSGEHGDGLARSELLPKMFGNELIDAFRRFKRAFDPDGKMNPGVIVDAEPLDAHLRLQQLRPRDVRTHFDFSREGGFAGAALKCVGIGKCRKTESGAMCPSYMATREEMHSTRGRARILYEAMAGALPIGGLADPAVAEAMDLCLACKACKSECPASVDMATYKAEFLSHYYRAHRRPLSAHLFGRIHELARFAQAAPRLANALSHNRVAGAIFKRIAGIHQHREFPRFAPQTFRSWFASRRRAETGSGREVIFFPDTFTNFFEPEVAIAAVEVLGRAGFRVTIPPRDICCGRPLYDQGMLPRAKQLLKAVLEVLGPAAARGVAIVGVEPGCILTFRDELPVLFPNDARVAALSDRSMLFDEFFAREAKEFVPSANEAEALVHGHCHHRSLVGLDCEAAVLQRIRGLNFKVLDSGCCGMAGAFGYDARHFDVSRKIGERALFPAVNASRRDTIVIADGFSCRAQIRAFCPDRRPMHIAQVLNAR
jgi:FAD/FMN-containing dehydrogenase/Fe-S oxidoreductase